jgi:hypothetical protein
MVLVCGPQEAWSSRRQPHQAKPPVCALLDRPVGDPCAFAGEAHGLRTRGRSSSELTRARRGSPNRGSLSRRQSVDRGIDGGD